MPVNCPYCGHSSTRCIYHPVRPEGTYNFILYCKRCNHSFSKCSIASGHPPIAICPHCNQPHTQHRQIEFHQKKEQVA